MTDGRVALSVRHVSKSFDGQLALDDVSLEIAAGEIHGLVGHNGSGKSTLIKILAGYHRADRGEFGSSPGEGTAERRGSVGGHLRFVHQDLGLVDTMDTVDNLALGTGYDTGRVGRIRWRSEIPRARHRMRRLNATHDVRVPVGQLAPVERTMIALARALADPQAGETGSRELSGVLVLDEPTATLSRVEVDLLLGIVRRIATDGLGVLFVSHRLDEVLAVADRISVLRNGRLVGTFGSGSVDRHTLAELVAGRRVGRAAAARDAARNDRPVLRLRGLTGPRLAGVDIDVAAGEIVGVAGVLGSGREELAGSLFGLSPGCAGDIVVDGVALDPPSPRTALAAGLALVPADRAGLGAVSTMSVGENMSLPWLRSLRRRRRLDHRAERGEVGLWCRKVDVRPATPDRPFTQLSGGNQQKVVLARWLRTNPRVLVLDGPTNGVDVGAKEAIHRLVVEAASQGAAVLVCSSDDEELAALCRRVIVLRDGRIVAELSGDHLSAEDIVATSLGGGRRQGLE